MHMLSPPAVFSLMNKDYLSLIPRKDLQKVLLTILLASVAETMPELF